MSLIAWFIIGFYLPFIGYGIVMGLEWLNTKMDEIIVAVNGKTEITLKERNNEQV